MTLAELRAVVNRSPAPRPDPELLALAIAAKQAVRDGVDPLLALSFVLWPTPDALVALQQPRRNG